MAQPLDLELLARLDFGEASGVSLLHLTGGSADVTKGHEHVAKS
jgi:hypothetical protein